MTFNDKLNAKFNQNNAAAFYNAARVCREAGNVAGYNRHMKQADWYAARARSIMGIQA